MKRVNINKKDFELNVLFYKNNDIEIDGRVYKLLKKDNNSLTLNSDGQDYKCFYYIDKSTDEVFLSLNGKTYNIKNSNLSLNENEIALNPLIITSPMPGKIFKVLKKVGDKVKKGESIVILEAMKMEHALKAALDGEIVSLDAQVGQQVGHGQVIITLKEK